MTELRREINFQLKKIVDILLCKTRLRLHLRNDLWMLEVFRRSKSQSMNGITIYPKIYCIQLSTGTFLL